MNKLDCPGCPNFKLVNSDIQEVAKNSSSVLKPSGTGPISSRRNRVAHMKVRLATSQAGKNSSHDIYQDIIIYDQYRVDRKIGAGGRELRS